MFFDDYDKIIRDTLKVLDERVKALSEDLVSNPVIGNGKDDIRYKSGVIYGLLEARNFIKDLQDKQKGIEEDG